MGIEPNPAFTEQPEWDLRALIQRDLGVTIDPVGLVNFIRLNWRQLSPLAHQIHDPKRFREQGNRK